MSRNVRKYSNFLDADSTFAKATADKCAAKFSHRFPRLTPPTTTFEGRQIYFTAEDAEGAEFLARQASSAESLHEASFWYSFVLSRSAIWAMAHLKLSGLAKEGVVNHGFHRLRREI